MSIFKKLALATAGAVVSTALAADIGHAIAINTTSYNSTTCNTTDGCISAQPGVTTVNFNSGTNPSNEFATYTTTAIRSGYSERPGLYSRPENDTSAYLAIGPGVGLRNVTIDFVKPVNYFGFYWGSIDRYSSVSLFKDGQSTAFATYNGSDFPVFNDSQVSSRTSLYLDFFANDKSEYFNKVVLSSSGNAFESDNHAYRAASPLSLSPSDNAFESKNQTYQATPVPFEFSPGLGILVLGAWGATARLNSIVQKRKSLLSVM